MLLERAELLIKSGAETAFAAAMHERGIPLLRGVAGVRSVSMGRGVENPGKFMLLVEWESMDAHAAFSKDSRNASLREVIRPHSQGGSMEHFDMYPT